MQKRLRRAISLLLTFAMLCGLLCTTSFAAGGTWSGSGTADNPYLIEDAADLEALSTNVNNGTSKYTNTYFKLTDDITVSDWNPIGPSSSKCFAGNFDGDGHTITINGISSTYYTNTYSSYAGLFSYLTTGAVVHDVTVDGSISYAAGATGNTYVAGIAGYAYGAILVNCVNKAAISTTSTATSIYVGGIAAYTNVNTTRVYNCYNTGTVTADNTADNRKGGIVGLANSGTFQYCYTTTGNVYGNSYGTFTECYDATTWSGVTDADAWVDAGNALAVSSGYSAVDDFWSLGSDGTPEHTVCDHQHAEDDLGIVTDPTCTDKGYTTYTCTICGKAYKADYVDALGHDLETTTVEASCTEDGSVTETCKRDGCGYTNTTVIPALGHEYEDGYCIRCEAKEPSIKTVTIGEGTSKGTGSSCTPPYNPYYYLSFSELIYPADAVGSAGSISQIAFQVAATGSLATASVKIYMGHTSKTAFSSTTDWMAADELTLVYEGSPTLGTAAGWEALELTTPFEYNGTDNLVIAVSRKSNSTYSNSLAYYYTAASDYAALYRRTDSGGDSYADYSDVTTAGTRWSNLPNIQLTMNVCAHENSRVVETVDPTCTEDGYTLNHCEDCGQDFKTDIVPALGHDIEGVTPVVVEPDCTKAGSETYICKNCGEEIVVEIPALGHDYGEDGICTVCGERKLETVDDFFAGLNSDYVTATYTASDWTVTTLGEEKSIKTTGSTYSTKYLTFNAQVAGTISFDYYIYGSSATYIKTYYDSALQNTYYGSYSPTWTNYTYHMDAGKTFQIAAYYYSSSAYPAVKSITFTPDCLHPTTTPSDVEATCTVGAHTDYICDTCGAIVSTEYTSEPLGHLNPVYTSNGDGATHTFTCERGDGATEACTFVDRVCIYCGQKAPSVTTIGSGQSSSSSYTPYCCYYKNSLRDIIYTADEIGSAGTITQIAFKVATAAQLATTSVKIYMGHTSKDEFTSSTDWIPAADLTLVYSGAPTLATAVGWETLELDTAFDYNGTDNLVVVVSKTASAYSSASYFYTQTSDYTTMFRQSDTDATYANYDNVTTTASYYHGYRPDIQLTFADEEEEPVVPTEPVTYEIGTEAELRAFAAKVAGGEYNANGKLTADIELTADWTPIGTYENPYTGAFDGDGHTISGLHINGADTCAGLFGYVNGVTVQNLIVKGYVRSTAASGSAGAVAAHASGENTFTNVGAEAIVISANTNTGYYATGGILGFVETNSAAVLTGCYNKGAVVTKSGYAGGIVGGSNSYYANTDAGINASITLTDCYNLGSVSKTGTGGYAGGIIGYSHDAALTNCYNLGTVTEGYGELAGNVTEGTAGTNCYTSADANMTAANLGSGYKDGIDTSAPALTWETAAYAAPVTLTGITITTLPDKTSYTTTETFDPAGMVVTANYSDGSSQTVTGYTWSPADELTTDVTAVTISYNDYRTVVDDVTAAVDVAVRQEIHTVTFVCDEGVYIYVGSGGPGYEVLGGDSRPTGVKVYDTYSLLLLAKAEDGYTVASVTADVDGLYVDQDGAGNNYYKIDSVTSDMTITVTAAEAEKAFPGTGTGTANDPYLIQNEADLRTLAEKVNGGTDYYGVFFKMTADIELTSAWTPIGTGNYTSGPAFKGTFDGDGHTVSGLSIEMSDAQNNNGYGLFGLVNGATIKNLAVSGEITNATDDTDAGYKSYFGGIVGVAYNGVTLENCAGHVDVTNRYYKNSSASTASLEESYVGGLVGYSTGGTLTITNCYSDGAVTNQNTSTTYGAGESSTYSWVGGLVGGFYHYGDTASTITNSFACGSVTGGHANHNAAIIASNGNSYGSVTVTNCYYLSGMAGDTTGSTAKSAADLLTLASTLNTNAGSTLFADGNEHPIFTWETEPEPETPAVTPDTSWYSEESDSFTITTEAQLLGFAQLVNEGTDFAGKTVALGNDIALTVEWTPIGVYASDDPFSGTFQGGGHTISGLNIARKTTQDYNALFGYIEGATIEKLIVTGSVTGGNYTAGIVGRALNSFIQCCGNEATVSGSGYVGGIVGYANTTRILACYNKGDISNSKTTDAFTAGIAGYLTSTSTSGQTSSVQSSYNTGTITGSITSDGYSYTGGIAGLAWSYGIMNSYNAGPVTGETYVGGILGSGNLYYQQSGYNYYLEGTAAAGAGTGADSTEYIMSVSADDLKDMSSDAVLNLGTAYEAPAEGANNGYPVLKWETDPDYQYGYITEIYTAAQMREFANNVRGGYSYAGETVKLMNDIDLGGVYDSSTGIWTAIGDVNQTMFEGTFDGQGNTISGMLILNDNSGSLGLFSVLPYGAVVRNLIVDGLIETSYTTNEESACVGSIAGWNMGTVENCTSYVDISAYNYYSVGGIVGDDQGTVTGCTNYGEVNGHSTSGRVGGIVGRVEPKESVDTALVENCANYGNVTGGEYVGGVVGAIFNESVLGSLTLTGCANEGDVTGSTYAGGIVGKASLGELTISNCYSSGTVTATYYDSYFGHIAGDTKADIFNSYYMLDGTDTLSAGDSSGDNYTRPVSGAYMATDAFDEMVGIAAAPAIMTLALEGEDEADYYAYDVWTVNVVGNTITVTRLENAFTSSIESITVNGTTYSITGDTETLEDTYGNIRQAVFTVDGTYTAQDVVVNGAEIVITAVVNGVERTITYSELLEKFSHDTPLTYTSYKELSGDQAGETQTIYGIAGEYVLISELLTYLGVNLEADTVNSVTFRPVDWNNNDSNIRVLPTGIDYDGVALALTSYQGTDSEPNVDQADHLNTPRLVYTGESVVGFESVKWVDCVTVTYTAAATYTVTLSTGDGYTAAPVEGYTTTVAEGGAFQFTVTAADGYQIDSVMAGETELTADADGVYTIESVTADVNVTVTVTASAPEIVYGDVDGSGAINLADYMLIRQYISGTADLDADQLIAADVDGDGIITLADYMLIRQYINGSITVFPVEE